VFSLNGVDRSILQSCKPDTVAMDTVAKSARMANRFLTCRCRSEYDAQPRAQSFEVHIDIRPIDVRISDVDILVVSEMLIATDAAETDGNVCSRTQYNRARGRGTGFGVS